uniref:Uncharacterized protein n=1 Tax=Arundo donax TaxID=35708 RepID=A0A0A9E8J8_ARUDO
MEGSLPAHCICLVPDSDLRPLKFESNFTELEYLADLPLVVVA